MERILMNEVLGIIIAAILCWLNFVIIDTYFGLPEQPGVRGARIIGQDVEKRGGDIAGGFFQGNILCSPDASAGTLLASIGFMLLGIPGGILAAFFVFIGNRLCADPGYAGTVGSLTITFIIFLTSFIGLTPEMYIVGMIIAILTIQGISQVKASIVLGKIAKKFNRHARE
jgi:energy-converting hydrogenase A subunit B